VRLNVRIQSNFEQFVVKVKVVHFENQRTPGLLMPHEGGESGHNLGYKHFFLWLMLMQKKQFYTNFDKVRMFHGQSNLFMCY